MKTKKRILYLLLEAAMILTLSSAFAPAAWAADKISYIDADGTEQTQPADNVIAVTSGTTALGTGGGPIWYSVSGNVPIGSHITVTGDVHLILEEGCNLTVNGGINVTGSNSLTIYGQTNGTGELTANGGDSQAGIGGGGKITINGGAVRAQGGTDGAGIGGGSNGGGGEITINGGTVTAESNGSWGSGAGIGGGNYGSGGKITINGGTVTAESRSSGAGIGGGNRGNGGEITINGGTVTAKGGTSGGAGIGGGNNRDNDGDGGNGGKITINGGTVTAEGSGGGADIGGGNESSSDGTLDIKNAIVFASSVTNGSTDAGRKNAVLVIGDRTEFYDSDVPNTVTLTGDYIIPAGRTLSVPADKTLCLEDGSLTVNGTLADEGNGSLTGNGTLINSGSVAISLAVVTDTGPYPYTGEAINPDLTVKIAGTTLTKDEDYTVFVSNNTDAGAANYEITGITAAHYTGTKMGTFAIGKAMPTAITWPSATNLYKDAPLSSSELSGGAASVSGSFAWTNGDETPSASAGFGITFTPGDTANYNSTTGTANVTVIDRDALSALIASATHIKDNATVGEGHGQYTQGAKDTLAAAIETAQGIYDTAAAINTQGAINTAVTTLQAAISAFNEEVIAVNFVKSDGKITEAKTIDRGTYTAATWEALQAAIAGVEAARGTQYVTQEALDEALSALISAIDGLRTGNGGGSTGSGGGGSAGNDDIVTNPVEPPATIVDEDTPLDGSVDADNPPFTDAKKSDWFYDDVTFAYDRGLFKGTSATEFSPNAPITRAMFVTVLYRFANEPVVRMDLAFNDVKEGAYYHQAVNWAKEFGVVAGVSDDLFAPEQNMTREQMATILLNYAKYLDKGPAGAWAVRLPFEDVGKISDWAVEGAMWSYMNGVVSGKPANLFDPQGTTTRAEVAAVFHRLSTSEALD